LGAFFCFVHRIYSPEILPNPSKKGRLCLRKGTLRGTLSPLSTLQTSHIIFRPVFGFFGIAVEECGRSIIGTREQDVARSPCLPKKIMVVTQQWFTEGSEKPGSLSQRQSNSSKGHSSPPAPMPIIIHIASTNHEGNS
jgi:hypothetical protein